MTGIRPARRPGATTLVLLLACLPSAAVAQQRFAVVISGASGEPKYAENYDRWRATLLATLRQTFAFPADHVIELCEHPASGALKSTRENVLAEFGRLRSTVAREDLLLVVLIGHGTFDGVDAKFNLVGPDLEADEWRNLLRPISGRLVVANTTAGSFPFLERLSGPGRIVLTATDSGAQVYETVFPEFFVQGLDEPAADLDKNGRVSILESFMYASTRVRQWYEQKGQLSTERPLLDDNADGVGKEAGAPGPDGALASRTYLSLETANALAEDPVLGELMRRRAELGEQVARLKLRKEIMPPGDYEQELERLLIELARVSREIRAKTD